MRPVLVFLENQAEKDSISALITQLQNVETIIQIISGFNTGRWAELFGRAGGSLGCWN